VHRASPSLRADIFSTRAARTHRYDAEHFRAGVARAPADVNGKAWRPRVSRDNVTTGARQPRAPHASDPRRERKMSKVSPLHRCCGSGPIDPAGSGAPSPCAARARALVASGAGAS